jgi:hypothetical protein
MHEDKTLLQFNISFLITILVAVTLLLIVLSVALNIYYHKYNDLAYITFLFDLDSEMNIPTRYASELLAISGFLFFFVYRVKRKLRDKFTFHWLFLSFIFFLMALDESVMLHEQTSQFFRGIVPNLDFAWVIPGSLLVLVFVIAYLKFFFNLEPRFRKLFFLSAFIFVSGALGMEIVGNFYQAQAGQDNIIYSMMTNVEESLEMAGAVLLIYSLTVYLMHLGPNYRIEFILSKKNKKLNQKPSGKTDSKEQIGIL